MKRNALGRAAISSLIVATTMVGCSGAAFRPSVAVLKEKQNPKKLAVIAEKAIAAHDSARAIQSAEAAVQLAPQDAGYRALLGRAYVGAGRFASAETALSDAQSLGDRSSRTAVGLALVKVALGKADGAQQLLAANRDSIPAGDYGLAVAMAGDPVEGVRILTEAVQGSSADGRTRQNLAYAYALAGRWKDARVMAGQDLDPLAANQRISQWAMMADPALAPQRVAALLGTSMVADDAGQPVALALGSPAPAQPAEAAMQQLAEATPPAPLPAPAPVAPSIIETAASAPIIEAAATPVRVAAAPAKAPEFIVETVGAARKGGRIAGKATAPSAVAAATPVARMQQVAYLKPVGNGASNWVVQLGAYDTAAIAKEKWTGLTRGNAALAAFPVLTSQATVKGKPFHRLAISGFANHGDAMALCRTIKAQRGQCFVREGAPGATPQRWAAAAVPAKGRQYASR
ncbi:MAG: tetratricopeptide repeat protein [Sphingobium sp.]